MIKREDISMPGLEELQNIIVRKGGGEKEFQSLKVMGNEVVRNLIKVTTKGWVILEGES